MFLRKHQKYEFFALFEKYSIFNENSSPEDDVRAEIWLDALLAQLTQNSEYAIGFGKLLLQLWAS